MSNFIFYLFTFIVLFCPTYANVQKFKRQNVVGNESSARDSFLQNEIVPNIIPQAPDKVMRVVFPSGQQVELGNILSTTITKNKPQVAWNYTPNALYTVAKIDPDAPSRSAPLFGEVKHWLVINVKGNDVGSGETLAEYIGDGLPKNSGLHRYIFLVYEQPNGIPMTIQPQPGSPINMPHQAIPLLGSQLDNAASIPLPNPIPGNPQPANPQSGIPQPGNPPSGNPRPGNPQQGNSLPENSVGIPQPSNQGLQPQTSTQSNADRKGFKMAAFAQLHNLGTPIAGNFYQSQFEDNLPNVPQQSGGK